MHNECHGLLRRNCVKETIRPKMLRVEKQEELAECESFTSSCHPARSSAGDMSRKLVTNRMLYPSNIMGPKLDVLPTGVSRKFHADTMTDALREFHTQSTNTAHIEDVQETTSCTRDSHT